ncbi:MAG: hypothetical protein RR957_06960, partial [Oscillospiraceae bacterium]
AGFPDKKRLCHLNSEDYNHMYSCDLEDDNHVRKDELKNAVQKVLDSVSESASENIFLGFEGTDFTAPLKEIPKALKMANDICGDAVELVHSTPLMYFDEFRKDVDLEKLQKYEGEMRFGPVGHLHSETMGSNVEIKQAMFKAENMILSYAEPLSSMAYMNGDEYPFDMLNLAWKYLLSSQAHDSIHGAGDPQIKKDNLNRLEKVHHISEFIIKKEVENIARQININNFLSDDIILMVINPSQYDRSEIMKVCIDLPAAELVKDFWIEDMDGNRIEMYEHTKSEFKLAMIHSCIRPKTVPSLRRDVDIFAKDIPSMGYKLYKIKRIKGDPNGYPEPFPVGTFPHSSIAKSGNVLDNGILKLKINSDGTLSVYDYETKTLHDNINS